MSYNLTHYWLIFDQVACSCYYEAVHDIELKTSGLAINHPNQVNIKTCKPNIRLNKVQQINNKNVLFHQYFKESQMRLHPERFEKKSLTQVQSQVKSESQVKHEVKTESNKEDGFEDMDDFDM